MTKKTNLKVVLIGSGNVAWHIGKAMIDNEIDVLQIYSPQHAFKLATEWNIPYTHDLSALNDSADVYLFAIKDDSYQKLVAQFPFRNKCMVHTSGSVDIDVFQEVTNSYGVLYPFQTFTKNVVLPFDQVPLCVEANDEKTEEKLKKLAHILSRKQYVIDSHTRRYLHLAGVFACNFTNALYGLAKDITEEKGLDFSILLPLINETARKVNLSFPEEVQTGPAVRKDMKIIEKHLRMLDDEKVKNVYKLISEIIAEKTT